MSARLQLETLHYFLIRRDNKFNQSFLRIEAVFFFSTSSSSPRDTNSASFFFVGGESWISTRVSKDSNLEIAAMKVIVNLISDGNSSSRSIISVK